MKTTKQTKAQKFVEAFRKAVRERGGRCQYTLHTNRSEIWFQSAHCTAGVIYAVAKQVVNELGFRASYFPPIRSGSFRSYTSFTVFLKRNVK